MGGQPVAHGVIQTRSQSKSTPYPREIPDAPHEWFRVHRGRRVLTGHLGQLTTGDFRGAYASPTKVDRRRGTTSENMSDCFHPGSGGAWPGTGVYIEGPIIVSSGM